MSSNFVLTLSCADRPGIVAAVTTELAGLGCNIAESNQFWDQETGQFFMRLAFAAPDGVDRDGLERGLKPAIERFGMRTTLVDEAKKKKILVMVSKFDHTLLHLLYQIRVGWLDAEVVAIVSNHEHSRKTADYEGIPFHLLPVGKDNKAVRRQVTANRTSGNAWVVTAGLARGDKVILQGLNGLKHDAPIVPVPANTPQDPTAPRGAERPGAGNAVKKGS